MFNKKYSEEIAKEIIKSISEIKIESIETSEKYTMVITSEVEDRDGEIIRVAGIDFSNYLKNPVVLQDHSYKVEDIIGKTISLKKEGDNLIAEFVFSNTEYGILAKELYEGGFLKTSSIGFIPLERDATNRSIITKCELLEWSLVAVPSNPEALSMDGKALYQKAIEAGIIKDITQIPFNEQLRELIRLENPTINKYDIYINEIYSNEFVYSIWIKDEGDKYFRRGYINNGGTLSLSGENIEVQPKRMWVDKKEFSELKSELSEIKSMLKSLADDNAEIKQSEAMRKQAQELAKGLSAYLCEAKKSAK